LNKIDEGQHVWVAVDTLLHVLEYEMN